MVDVWSLGILLFELCHQHSPFTDEDPTNISNNILKSNLVFREDLSSQYKDLVKSLLKRQPEQRYQISQIPNHEWIQMHTKTKIPSATTKIFPTSFVDDLQRINNKKPYNKIEIVQKWNIFKRAKYDQRTQANAEKCRDRNIVFGNSENETRLDFRNFE